MDSLKRDIHCHEIMYKNWKEKAVLNEKIVHWDKGISRENCMRLTQYVVDMELGQNVGRNSKKGGRSYGRLNVSRRKLLQTFKMLEEREIKDITGIKEKQLHEFFNDMYKGKIKRQDGKNYEHVSDFVRTFKAFWHWWMKVNRKEGRIINDICEDLELKSPATKFVYFTKEQLDEMLPYFTPDEQVLCLFLFDSLIRFPTECLSLLVKDVYEKDREVWVNIPDEVSKTFGRLFNLLYCGEELMKYIRRKDLNADDTLFGFIKDDNYVYAFNRKLKQAAVQVLGDKISHPKAQGKFSEISGYDFRHSGAIHLRVVASRNNSISLDALRQRLGHADFEMLNYYTQFLGLTGEIKKEALLVEQDKTRLEKEVEQLKQRQQLFERALQTLSPTPRQMNLDGQPAKTSISGLSVYQNGQEQFIPFQTQIKREKRAGDIEL